MKTFKFSFDHLDVVASQGCFKYFEFFLFCFLMLVVLSQTDTALYCYAPSSAYVEPKGGWGPIPCARHLICQEKFWSKFPPPGPKMSKNRSKVENEIT